MRKAAAMILNEMHVVLLTASSFRKIVQSCCHVCYVRAMVAAVAPRLDVQQQPRQLQQSSPTRHGTTQTRIVLVFGRRNETRS